MPISAVTGEGVPDLLMILVGLAQRFLKDNLKLTATGPGVGTILEVKEEKGLGTTLDVILYNGEFNSGDTVIVGTAHEPVVTKIRALLKPKPLAEIRSEERFMPVKHVVAAAVSRYLLQSWRTPWPDRPSEWSQIRKRSRLYPRN